MRVELFKHRDITRFEFNPCLWPMWACPVNLFPRGVGVRRTVLKADINAPVYGSGVKQGSEAE